MRMNDDDKKLRLVPGVVITEAAAPTPTTAREVGTLRVKLEPNSERFHGDKFGAEYRRLRAMLVDPYRPARETPRPGLDDVPERYRMTDPAPPWVPAVVDTLLPRFRFRAGSDFMRVGLIHGLLEWCAAGDAVARAEQILSIARAWVGGELDDVMRVFMNNAITTKAGRRKGGKARPRRLVETFASWEEHDEAKRAGSREAAIAEVERHRHSRAVRRITHLENAITRAAETFDDLERMLKLLRHETAAEACAVAARGTRDALKEG